MKCYRRPLILLMVIVSLIVTAVVGFVSTSAKDQHSAFIDQLKADPVLKSLKAEGEIVAYIKNKAKESSINYRDAAKAAKEYINSSSPKESVQPKAAKAFDAELEKKRQEHFAKVAAVEAAIQKHVKYKTKAAFEKNIDFLLSNDIGLDEELVGYYIAGYYDNIKDERIKARADKFLKPDSFNSKN